MASSPVTPTRCSSCARWTTCGCCGYSIRGAAHRRAENLGAAARGRRACVPCWGSVSGAELEPRIMRLRACPSPSSLLHQCLAAPAAGRDQEAGTFWMRYETFVERFDDIYVCRIFSGGTQRHAVHLHGEWRGESAAGCSLHDGAERNPQFGVRASEAAQCAFVLSQVALPN